MSKIISEQTGLRGFGHIVETEDGKQYVVSCVEFEPDSVLCKAPYELAVFRWNKKAGKVTNWSDLIMRRYYDMAEMLQKADDICSNLETYLTKVRRIAS